MAQVEFKVKGLKRLMDRIRNFDEEVMQAARTGLWMGMRAYEAHIVKNMLSGRKSPGYGLYRQTGTAARSWHVGTEREGDNFKVTLGSTATYLVYHQQGGGRVPKRLYVYEEFKTAGRQLLEEHVAQRMRKLL